MSPEIKLAALLFEELARETADPPGITRATFGEGEAFAHRLMADAAREMDLEISHDVAGNQYMTLPGRDRSAARIVIGSHLDSVRHGGNFDGAAGVIAGLAAVQALKNLDHRPERDITVMAIRAEELVWFPTPYCGSRMAFGLLTPDDYGQLRRSDTGRSLAEHMRKEGFDPDALMAGACPLSPEAIHCFIEVHIEQGPTLEERGYPLGIVSGIRGNLRYRYCSIAGQYAHAGATPRIYRQDAVLAGTEFVQVLDAIWSRVESDNRDLVATVGEFWTEPEMHGMTKVPGKVNFTMDIRSLDNALLIEIDQELREQAGQISNRRNVAIVLGEYTNAPPAEMAPYLRQTFEWVASDAGVSALHMVSGAGHDCATFAWQGIDCGMLFIRNQNGSHNPDESMNIEDFAESVRVLVGSLKEIT